MGAAKICKFNKEVDVCLCFGPIHVIFVFWVCFWTVFVVCMFMGSLLNGSDGFLH